MISFDQVHLRPSTWEDLDWLEPFYERVMRPYVELTHEWDPERYGEYFYPEVNWIVQWEGRDIGLLGYEVRTGYLYLNNIQLEEGFRGRGIGTHLVRRVLALGEELGLPVRLRVLKGNPALGLYQRLGFTIDPTQEQPYSIELVHA
jgi:ribosomal protein S18 acetylase RimI-like enzyme